MPARAGLFAVLASLACGVGAAESSVPFVLKSSAALGEAHAVQADGRPMFGSGEAAEGRGGREVTLIGDAELRRAGSVFRADRITYYSIDDELAAVGRVRLVRGGNVFTGPEMQLRVDANEGYLQSPSYSIPLHSGRGTADRVDFLGPQRLSLHNATYTTCRAADPDWYLRADSLEIDEGTQVGIGRSGTVGFKNRAILWAPYFEFPLNDERRSGFLPPTIAPVNNRTGPEVMVPYYWNIAPNRDMTVYNRVMARRGYQLGGLFRYLEPVAFGETRAEMNMHDTVTGTERYFFSSNNTFTNLMGWSGVLNLRGVSDDNYFVDYSRTIADSATHSLPREGVAARVFGDWTVIARAQRFQNIMEARAAPPYERLPQITGTHNKLDFGGFDFITTVDAAWFRRPLVESPEGMRLVVNPTVSYPIVRPGWFVTPRVSWNYAGYELNRNGAYATTVSRSVPSFSIDSGLVFERGTRVFDRDYTQTLEPRLFYVRTPYRDQSAIPVFDSATADFNFAQLFSENRFIGSDRIGDANQLTAALVTRLISPGNGVEHLRLALGQRYYFWDQRVTIPGAPVTTDKNSDILLALLGDTGKGLTFDTALQYSWTDRSLPRAGFNVRYRGTDSTIFNTGVRYQRNVVGQFDTSWRLPLGNAWTSLGRINYSFLKEGIDPATGVLGPAKRGIVEGVLGVEYRRDCWAARVVLQRFVTAAATSTTALFLQLELTGLGRVGSDPFDILQRNIPGYRLPTDRPTLPTRYFGYE